VYFPFLDSYCLESNRLQPNKDDVADALAVVPIIDTDGGDVDREGVKASMDTAGATFAAAPSVLDSISAIRVLTRDAIPGITCPLALAGLAAASNLPFASDPETWNAVTTTIFSRSCEAIGGELSMRLSKYVL
jgi:hypothetical protein